MGFYPTPPIHEMHHGIPKCSQIAWGDSRQTGILTPPQPQCFPNQEFLNNWFPYWKANVNLVGWSKNIGTPQFLKTQDVLLRRTPESIGAQPCRHCSSVFTGINVCKHSQKGEKMAQVNLIQLKNNDLRAQKDYNSLFYDLDPDSEEGSSNKPFVWAPPVFWPAHPTHWSKYDWFGGCV